MERGAEHVARRRDRAGDESVDAAELDHYAAEVDALRAEGLLRRGEVDDLLLLRRLLRLLGVPRLEIGLLQLGVACCVVDRLDAALGELKPGLRLGIGDLLGGAEHDRRADLAVDARARGGYDAGVHALGQNDRAVQL